MVADFLNSQQEDEDSELYKELEMAMKETAATVYIGEHFLLSFCYADWSRFHSWGRNGEA